MTRLHLGKIPIEILNSTFLRLTGASSDRVVTPPLAGLDFAALRVGEGYMIVSADPVTGVVKDIGRYAVNVSANDVATSGSKPQFMESVVLLPEGSDAGYVKKIAGEMNSEAKKLGISIVGGHSELTPGLKRPIIVVTAFSFVDEYVSSREAREGDTIMITKTAGIEGTAVLLKRRKFLHDISVVEEAVTAYHTGYVHAMHDCTEGGVLGAVFEMSVASDLGFELLEREVPVAQETEELCRKLSIDPLRLVGSGSVLLSVEGGREAAIKRALGPICRVTDVGKFTHRGRVLVRKSRRRQRIRAAPEDELWRVLARPTDGRKRL